MAVVTWSDDYSVDIQEIDEQHKSLFNAINELDAALSAKEDEAVIAQVLEDLVTYTMTHFAVEECLMRIFGYENYDEHKSIHDDIRIKVRGYHIRFKNGDKRMGMELLMFLKDWIGQHIKEEDTKYAPLLQKAGVKKNWIKKFW